jgi:hypothetical protein
MFALSFENGWLFPAVESFHLAGMAVWSGCVALRDFADLGLVPLLNRAPGPIWFWAGLTIQLSTGPLLFLGNPTRYMNNPAFLAKVLLLALALSFHFLIRRRRSGRGIAVTSLSLWSFVVLAARSIADFDAN